MSGRAFPIDAAGLVPHARPMLAIDTVLSADAGGARVALRVPANAWYMNADGRWDELAGIELIAQAAAAFSGLAAEPAGPAPAIGYLAEVREYRVEGVVSAGDALVVDVRKKAEFGGFVVISGELTRGDTVVAAAELTFWLEAPGKQPRRRGAGDTERRQND